MSIIKKDPTGPTPDEDPFVEIEMGQLPFDGDATFAPTPTPTTTLTPTPAPTPTPVIAPDPLPVPALVWQPLTYEPDLGKRSVFYSMRQIAREHLCFEADHAKVFYMQALFMKDFTDDYAGYKPLTLYYPCYQQMDIEQLRTYFTWRTQVRKGNIARTCASYAFLYVYELLHLIGCVDPEDGLDRLMSFWQLFRVFDPVLDRYVLQWIKDYHIYYPLPVSFRDFVDNHDLRGQYPAIFSYESRRHDSFGLFAGISKYPIRKSVFYGEKKNNESIQKMIHDCFYFILLRLRKLLKEKDQCFEDLVFCPLTRESAWIPFCRALFYPALHQADRQVILTEREVYQCQNNHWTAKTVFLTENGRQLIGYIMKEMEASLRQKVGFKYKLSADLKVCDSKTRKTLKNMEISLPNVIRESVAEYYALITRKKITINVGYLEEIRKEAQKTQEKLIVPEETGASESVCDLKEIVGGISEPGNTTELRQALTSAELEALRMALDGQDIRPFALQKGMMSEVLVDAINQKAVDCIGDIVLELDDCVRVCDDYREKLMKMVKD